VVAQCTTPIQARVARMIKLDVCGNPVTGAESAVVSTDGFISIERFQSISNPERFVSLSFWRDEESVRKWRNLQQHREAQAKGRAGIFAAYRLRVAQVMRDYTHESRSEAPADSVKIHG